MMPGAACSSWNTCNALGGPCRSSAPSTAADGPTLSAVGTAIDAVGPLRARVAATTTSTSQGATISGATSLASVHTASSAPATNATRVGIAARVPHQMPTTARTRKASRSGRRCPPTESNANGATTSAPAAAYAITVRCRARTTTSPTIAATVTTATTFCTRSTVAIVGRPPTIVRSTSPASPRRTNPCSYVTYQSDRPYSLMP
jgi:hypothetical protein